MLPVNYCPSCNLFFCFSCFAVLPQHAYFVYAMLLDISVLMLDFCIIAWCLHLRCILLCGLLYCFLLCVCVAMCFMCCCLLSSLSVSSLKFVFCLLFRALLHGMCFAVLSVLYCMPCIMLFNVFCHPSCLSQLFFILTCLPLIFFIFTTFFCGHSLI